MVKVVPKVLYNANIWTIRWPWQQIDVVFAKPSLNKLRRVLRIVVLLEIVVVKIQVKIAEGTQDIILQYLTV